LAILDSLAAQKKVIFFVIQELTVSKFFKTTTLVKSIFLFQVQGTMPKLLQAFFLEINIKRNL